MLAEGRVTVLLGDRHALFQEAVRSVLEGESDLRVVATAGDGDGAIAQAERNQPDVAVLSANLTACDAFAATSQIRCTVPDCRILVVAGDRDPGALARAVECGARGYLPQELPLLDVIEAIHAVHRGDMLIPPNMLGDLIETLSGRRNDREAARRTLSTLTRREAEVLALLARGADNDAMAARLFISPQTARTHVQNVLAKLDAHSRLEAVAFVNSNALLDELDAIGDRHSSGLPAPGVAGRDPRRRRHANAERAHVMASPLIAPGMALRALP